MDAFAAIADPVRRGLLRTLARGPARVVDLADGLTISRPAVSKHLRLLREADLVEAEDRGRERHYRLRPDGLEPVRAFVEGLDPSEAIRFPESALDALDLEVRRTVRDRVGSANAPTDHSDRPGKTDQTGETA